MYLGKDVLTDITRDSETKTSTTAGGRRNYPETSASNVQLDHLPDREHIDLGNLPYDQSPTFVSS